MKQLRKFILSSLVFHLFILTSIALFGVFFASKAKLFLPVIHVDIVALPDQVKGKESNLDTSLPIKDKPVPEEHQPTNPDDLILKKEQPKNEKQKAESILEKLKQEQQRKKLLKAEKNKTKSEKELDKFSERYRNAIRGNQINQGTSITGSMEQSINAYAGHVSEVLRSHWGLPAWLQSQNLRAIVRIYIGSDGQILRYEFQQHSTNDTFDEYVKAAIDDSGKFSPPPNEMAHDLAISGIDVIFPL